MILSEVRGWSCVNTKAICFLAFVLSCPLLISGQEQQTPKQTNDRIEQLASHVPTHRGDIPVGSGDLIHIDVFDVPDFSRDVRISQAGDISLPLVPGKIQAAGLTTFQLEVKIAEVLTSNGLVTHPQVSVFMKEQNSQPITVIGAVMKPMVYQEIRPTTLLEILSQAGGISQDAGSQVIVTRTSGLFPAIPGAQPQAEKQDLGAPQSITIQLRDLLETGESAYNILVFGGDVISVPRAGIIYVAGAVNQPGGYVLQTAGDQITALKAIALAHGLLGTSKAGQAVILRNDPNGGQKKEINVDLNKIMQRKTDDVRLYANDVLFVPDSKAKKVLFRTGESLLVGSSYLIYRIP